jgi:5-methyltetrahydropteroyltriglutamate--homocysteine methyltransferase
VVNLGDHAVESPADVAARVRRAVPFVPPERLVLAPDCGMKYLPRDVAYGKLCALAAAATALRAEFGASPATGAGP